MHISTRRKSLQSAVMGVMFLLALAIPFILHAQGLQNPLSPSGADISIEAIIGRIIRGLLGFVGILSLFAFVFAGAMFVASQGNAERVQKAKDIMLYAIIGIAVALGSYIVLSFVIDILTSNALTG